MYLSTSMWMSVDNQSTRVLLYARQYQFWGMRIEGMPRKTWLRCRGLLHTRSKVELDTKALRASNAGL